MTTLKTILLVGALGVSASTAWAGGGFVRGLALYINPSAPNYSDAGGAGLEVGGYLGKNNCHELNFETGYTRWDYEYSSAYEEFIPYLANYRYHLLGEGPFAKTSFYIGGTLGAVQSIENWNYSHRSYLSFAWGGSAGFNFTVIPHLELQLGYQYLRLKDEVYDGYWGVYRSTSAYAHVIAAGVGYRW